MASSTGFVKRSPSIFPHGGERGGAYFLPRNAPRPLQTVIYWPHGGFTTVKSMDDELIVSTLIPGKRGAAVAVPIFKGTLHRDPQDRDGGDDNRRRYRGACLPGPPDRVDERSVEDDRLRQTRDDLNGEKIVLRVELGSYAAPIVLAVEPGSKLRS